MNFLDHATANPNRHRRSTSLIDRTVVLMARIRFQLLAAILVGVVAPIILRGNFERFPDQVTNYDNSLYGTLSAVIFGYMIFRKVTSLAGATAFMNIIPSFLTSYGLVVAVFFALRLQYSRYQFIVSFILVVAMFYVLMFVLSRFRRSRFALMTDRKLSEFPRLPRVEWVMTPTPELASERRFLPLVVDLHSPLINEQTQRYIAEESIAGRRVYDVEEIKESLLGRVPIDRLAQSTFGHLAPGSIYAPAKRYVDALLAALFLIVLSPLMLLVALIIRLDSKGPAIFKQERMGFRGQPFTVYKFRSMRVIDESERDRSADMTMTDDDRITKIGQFIRRTRIDELPQAFNILRGEMSWIGPRPETLSLSSWYEKEIPFYRYRHMIRPGITGWAQVKQGHVTSVKDVRAKLEYDFYYVKNFSLWMDILIAIKTVGVMISGNGSK
ncbi:MAG: exopolysaccharide biosynthesis polyprenyl glycosylphosphotransferase [Henriciella sp.]|nr:exopolysaccharide biosynthesis polyprenyl glycosylphosphotransferase [Henriciella sp.]